VSTDYATHAREDFTVSRLKVTKAFSLPRVPTTVKTAPRAIFDA
jgi:hypothetical protein